jgi:hypothetical protein
VLTLDGATGKIDVLAKMPGWLIVGAVALTSMLSLVSYTSDQISGSISAFDPATGTLYGIFQQTGATSKDPFHLVGVNAQTGVVRFSVAGSRFFVRALLF